MDDAKSSPKCERREVALIEGTTNIQVQVKENQEVAMLMPSDSLMT
jgi:hypothetical protein